MGMDFKEFRTHAMKILKVDLEGYKEKRVERRTKSLMKRFEVKDFDACIDKLKNDLNFRKEYLNHFTINTSEFFRNPKNYVHLKNEVLPALLAQHQKIKIWSAPCSNGSEPYTIAIILEEMGIDPSRYTIIGSDLDPEILNEAKKGIYRPISLKNIPDDIFKKYFTEYDSKFEEYKLDRKIVRRVKFEKRDLINSRFNDEYHLILSRNFFIYLTKAYKDMMVEKFVDCLVDEGYFFIGSTEFIFSSNQFNLKKDHLAFYIKGS
jgi:chemotaxis protein methyltransferase CheR